MELLLRNGFVEVPGRWGRRVRLYYEYCGRGTPLLMLHGNGQDHRVFYPQMEEFEQEYFIVAPDSRGHGKSELGSEPLGFPLLAEDAKRILEGLNIEKAFVLGFSDGANTALELAMSCPERLLGVILIGGNLSPMGLKSWARVQALLRYRFIALRRDGREEHRRRRQQAALVAFQPSIDESRLQNIETPVLVIAGKRDLIREDHTQMIAAAIPNASLALIEKAGHTSLFKKQAAYLPVIRSFLKLHEPYGPGGGGKSE